MQENSMSDLNITVRKAEERGKADHGWLQSRFTFSFADYHDPQHMGFGPLRVMNDDLIQAGMGFGMHPHRDMEIISYVTEGALKHEDSMGNSSVIKPGDIQRMTAGTGVRHSEFNPTDQTTRLIQVWIEPRQKGLDPGYDQATFSPDAKRDKLCLLVSGDGRGQSLSMNQDASLYASQLSKGATVTHTLSPGHQGWGQVAVGQLQLNEIQLERGDGAAVEEPGELRFTGVEEAEILLFDLG
jgi:redox-sensitive bicupin YhaK (pirin superfamily)